MSRIIKRILRKIKIWIILGLALDKSFKLDNMLKMAISNMVSALGFIYIIVFFTFVLQGVNSVFNAVIVYTSAFIFIAAFIVLHTDKGIKYLNIVRNIVALNIVFFYGFIYIEVNYGKIWTFLIPILAIFLTDIFTGLIICVCYFAFILSAEYYLSTIDWKLFARWTCVYWSEVIVTGAYEALRITYNKKLHRDKERIEILNITDPLTNLYNRRYFSEAMDREFLRSIRQKESLSFLMIDADKFKDYNDTYGHLLGDELLASLAVIFKRTARRTADLVFRMGGEEFGVLLPSTDSRGAHLIAERIREEVQAQTKITVSVGVASVFPQVGESSEKLLKLADSNLYKAKEMGRNRVVG